MAAGMPGMTMRQAAQAICSSAQGAMFVQGGNRVIRTGRAKTALLAKVRELFVEAGTVLGLFAAAPAVWLEGIKAAKADQIDMAQDEIERLIAERADARVAKDFKRGDEIRDLLLAKGIHLLDSAQGTTWNVK